MGLLVNRESNYICTVSRKIPAIPQRALILEVPAAMWNDEAISQIGSTLEIPISARAMLLAKGDRMLALEVCVIIDNSYRYPMFVQLEGSCGSATIVTLSLKVQYDVRKPCCHRCQGYGHWASVYDKRLGKHWGKL